MNEVKLPSGQKMFCMGPQSASEAQAAIDRRHQVVLRICAEKGWDADPKKLSIEQILEIRKDQRWIDAGKRAQ